MTMFQKMKRFMLDNSYTHTDEWLVACMEWIGSNYNNISESACQKQVVDQWVDVNLEELESSCLPLNLAAQKCTKLTGKYGLQMNCVQDIGESSYNQWKQIKKLENENTNVTAASDTDNAWAPKPRRCLYLTLTDGRQVVHGLELVTIPILSLSLKPGVKLLLMGPIESRRGVLQLRPSNVKIIGGEVESMSNSHSVVALISERLSLPQGSSPTQHSGSSIPVAAPPTVITVMDTEDGDDGGFPDDLDDEDDQLFMEIDENLLIQQGADTQPIPPLTNPNRNDNGKPPKPKQLKIDGFMKPMPVVIKPPTPARTVPVTTADESVGTINSSTSDLSRRRPSSSNQSSVTGIVLPIVSSSPISYPIKVSGAPYLYIRQIKDNLEELTKSGKNVAVKVCVTTVNSNIEVVNGAWTLTVSINDGTGFLRCKLSSQLLNTLIGFDPAEMKRLKSLKTDDARQHISLGMKELTTRLVHLNAIVDIQLQPEPTIVNITDVNMRHVDDVKKRISVLEK